MSDKRGFCIRPNCEQPAAPGRVLCAMHSRIGRRVAALVDEQEASDARQEQAQRRQEGEA